MQISIEVWLILYESQLHAIARYIHDKYRLNGYVHGWKLFHIFSQAFNHASFMILDLNPIATQETQPQPNGHVRTYHKD